MPQIWLTYEELGAHLACSADAARARVIESEWSRRRCSDGATRVKLPPVSTTEYLARRADAATRAALSALSARIAELETGAIRPPLSTLSPMLEDRRYDRREAA